MSVAPTLKRRETFFNAPPIILAIALALTCIHLAALASPVLGFDAALREFAFLPGRWSLALWPEGLGRVLADANHDPNALEQADALRHFDVLDDGAKLWSVFTYALLHGSTAHVGLNVVWLVAFGAPAARAMSASRFLLLFGIGAAAGALAHWAARPWDFFPMIGASGAVSCIMGASARLAFSSRRSPSGRRILPTFAAIWLTTNVVFGAGAQTLGLSEAPVAWVAHIGGFVAGLVLAAAFTRPWLQALWSRPSPAPLPADARRAR